LRKFSFEDVIFSKRKNDFRSLYNPGIDSNIAKVHVDVNLSIEPDLDESNFVADFNLLEVRG
jgi:hypothetical protein